MNTLHEKFLPILFSFCLTISMSALSQAATDPADSLRKILQTSTDTTKVNILNDLSELFMDTEKIDTAIKYIDETIALAEKLNYKKGSALAYANKGRIRSDQENYPEAMRYFNTSLKIYESIDDKKNVANVYNLIANTYHHQGDFPNALKNQYSALKIREEIGDEEGIAWSYNNIATIYRIHGDLPEALSNFLTSLKSLEKFGDKQTIAIAQNNIGNVYSLQGKYTDALQRYYISLRLRETKGDIRDIIEAYLNIGDSYCDLFDKDSVTKEVTVEYPENIFNKIPKADWLDTALSFHSKAHAMIQSLNNKYYSIFSLSGMGRINFLKKSYNKSIELYSQAYAIAEEMNATELQKEIAKYLSDNYNRLNDYKSGMSWYVKYEAHKDTLLNKLKSDDLTKTRMRYEYEKKETAAKVVQDKKDVLAKVELDRQKKMRNIFLGAFAVIFLFASIFFYQRNHIRKEKIRSDDLLLNILPSEIASELKQTGVSQTKTFDEVTVMFTDFVDFTIISEKLSPELLVKEIHTCFSAFDNILQKYRVEKIKTIGDAYLCAGGLPVPDPEHALQVIQASIEIKNYIAERRKEKLSKNEIAFEIRIGIHSGPVVAGIVGVKKYAYDIWGDTVNIAARMEQNSSPGKINISQRTYELVKDQFNCTYRGKMKAKNKGEIDMYFLEV